MFYHGTRLYAPTVNPGSLPRMISTNRFDLVWLDARTLRTFSSSPDEALRTLEASNPDGLLTGDERAIAELFADRLERQPQHETWTIRAVIERESMTFVGHAGFHVRPDEHGVVEIGYQTSASRRREGIAREVVLGLLHAASTSQLVTTVRGITAAENRASQLLLESLGFVFSENVAGAFGEEERLFLFTMTPTT